jgi:glycosyltransferase involved in cell wall biosynthesis
VAIVPLRSGGGTRLKILEAMATGTAVVSTSVGCEGLDVEDGVNILVADTAENFAAAIEKTLVDDVFRRSLVTEARHLVEAKYDWDIIAKQHDIVYRQPIKHGCN